MSNPGEADLTPINSLRDLAGWFAAGSKPRDAWRVGTEHEKIGYRTDTLAPPAYEGGGIGALLEGLTAKGWERIEDKGNLIGLKRRGFDREEIHQLRAAYRLLFAHEGTLQERVVDVEKLFPANRLMGEAVRAADNAEERSGPQPINTTEGDGR